MDFSIHYGTKMQFFSIDSELEVDTIIPSVVQPAENQIYEVEHALENPIGFDWSSISDNSSVAIAVNDKTRPVPHKYLLPPLLSKLLKLGVPQEKIKFYIATGTHIPMQPEEFSTILASDILAEYHVESHDCDNQDILLFLGNTPVGTPVWANKSFFNSDFKIVIGNIEPHHFMGFSGGHKSASIGLTGRQTINRNHSLLLDDRSRLGAYIDNPMRQDVEEIGKLIGVHFAVNAILNDKKEIVKALAGDPLQVMAKGYPMASDYCQIPVNGFYDLVIASAGGYPKDINLYQAQKALTNASLITRDGGSVILVTECIEGVGSQGYLDFMDGIKSFEEALIKFRSVDFKVGPHKAYQFAKIGSRIKIILNSSIPQSQVEQLLLVPAPDLQMAIHEEINHLGGKPRIAILPIASITLPTFR